MAELEWAQRAYYETAAGDRVGLLALDDGHWAVCWAYAYPHSGMQMVSYDPERGQEVFRAAREQAEGKGGLSVDSRTAWNGGSL
ncbi:hypothetical protein PO587_02680 [Streptomyces gilvifuscus]|uniref:Immunity protein 35 domain-containing protein n=1 Tax=Streptomyces gilvifuscus TaxID=1550617 RepID=A0ABT5FLF5_9ACTN|nr:hypothetical protein [Streptomyces gilvifuscus]MDC2953356.1 hypothetical protein [Streptomyces gilvifuscus]